jgi:hypothetical protein
MLNFNCDRPAKCDFTASTTDYVTVYYPQFTGITYYEADDDGDLVPFGDLRASSTAHIDVYMELSSDSTDITYAIELKERWGKYTSTYYGEEGGEGWVYNIEKDDWLLKEKDNGRIPLFANLYPDDKITIWRIDNVDRTDIIEKPIKRVNIDPDSQRVTQKRLQLWNKDGKTIRRIRHR